MITHPNQAAVPGLRTAVARLQESGRRIELQLEQIEACAEHCRFEGARARAVQVLDNLYRQAALEDRSAADLAGRLDEPLGGLVTELHLQQRQLRIVCERIVTAAEARDPVRLRASAADLRGVLVAHLLTAIEDLGEPLDLLQGGASDGGTGEPLEAS